MSVQSLCACNIPVFLYALQRWQPDDYEIVVLYRKALDESQSDLLNSLHKVTVDPDAPANMIVRSVDLDQPLDKSDKQLIASVQLMDESPWILVRYPKFTDTNLLAFSGPFDEETVQALIDSPARRELVKRIIGGDSAVWIFIESGDRQKDDAAEKILAQRLAQLEKTLQLPGSDHDGIEALFPPDISAEETVNSPPVHFSVLRIASDSPDESVFMAMLLNSEFDLDDSEPIAIPIFGRGRSHFALVGAGINDDTIDMSCQFLVGACSCEVKAQNPGSDMLIRANWDILDQSFTDADVPPFADFVNVPLTGPASLEEVPVQVGLVNEHVESAPPADADRNTVPETYAVAISTKPIVGSIMAAAALGLIVIAVGTVLIKRRQDNTRL